MPDFIWLALLGGLLTTLITSPVGTFMLWRRMAYMGDALAHTSLLGLGLGLWLQVSFTLTLLFVALIVAISITRLQRQQDLGTDTFIAIAAHSSLALGLIAISLLPNGRIDLMGYLFGDLLSLSQQDLMLLGITSILTISLLAKHWQGLVMSSLNTELAQLAGYNPQQLSLLLALMIAIIVALSTKLVGALLMTALLITPAAIARRWSQTPLQMIVSAVAIGQTAIIGGISISLWTDLPVSPAVVALLFSGFLISRLLPNRQQSLQ